MPAPSNILFPSRLHLLNLPQTTLPTENQVFKCLSLCGTFLIQITAPIKLCLLRNVLVRIWYLFWTLADSSDLFHSLILSCMFAVDSLGCVVIRSTNLHPSPFILTWLLCESSYTVANEFRSFEKRTGTIHFITWLSLHPPSPILILRLWAGGRDNVKPPYEWSKYSGGWASSGGAAVARVLFPLPLLIRNQDFLSSSS